MTRLTLITTAALTGCVIVDTDKGDWDWESPAWTDSVDVEGAVTALVVLNGVGDVEVSQGESASVRVEAFGDASTEAAVVRLNDGTLTVEGKCPDEGICALSWSITVPSLTTLDVTVEVGDVDVEAASDATTVVNEVGDVSLRLKGEGTLSVLSEVGDINVEALGLNMLDLTNEVGDIAAEVARGAWNLTTEAEVGDVSLDDLSHDPQALRSLTARTGTGDVDLQGE